jgi:hypothetical protein
MTRSIPNGARRVRTVSLLVKRTPNQFVSTSSERAKSREEELLSRTPVLAVD